MDKHLIWWLAALAVLLTLPSLGVGLTMDDHFHRQTLVNSDRMDGILGSRLDLFRFFDGNPERTARMIDLGIVPWWTSPDLRGAFWRPVAAVTHWLDYRLWPGLPALMHAQSLVWYAALVAAVLVLYRRLEGPTVISGLAALLYAIDDGHGMPVGFLANRNALLATQFGVLTVISHDRWRRDRQSMHALIAPVMLTVSLLASEFGIATVAYLFAYTVFLDRGQTRDRYLALVPYAVLVFVWRLVWSLQGYGVGGGLEFYMDPLTEPIAFLRAVVVRCPILLLGQWACPPSDLSVLLSPESNRVLAAGASAFVLVIGWIIIAVLKQRHAPSDEPRSAVTRLSVGDSAAAVHHWPAMGNVAANHHSDDRLLGFWALGMLLSLIPICATFPADRLLLFVGLGAMPLLSRFLAATFRPADWPGTPFHLRRTAKVLSGCLIFWHGAIAPVVLAVRAAYPVGPSSLHERLYVQAPLDESVASQTVVIVNPPSVVHACYLRPLREFAGQPVPRRVRVLAPGLPSVTVRRMDPRTLAVRCERGYLAMSFDRLFRAAHAPLHVGDRVVLTGMTAEVTALTDDGRPAEVVFSFDVPLEDHSLRWLYWDGHQFDHWTPPSTGATVRLEDRGSDLRWLP